MKEGIDKLKLALDDIKLVVVSKGPGSFTGIRVGLSWVEGFCHGNTRKKIGVSSLEMLSLYLAKKYTLPEFNILLANTSTTGFLATYNDKEGCKLSFLGLENQEELLPSKKLNLFLDTRYTKINSQDAYKVFTREEIASLCFEALVSEFDTDAFLREDSANSTIDPLYLRKSSVEEKQKSS